MHTWYECAELVHAHLQVSSYTPSTSATSVSVYIQYDNSLSTNAHDGKQLGGPRQSVTIDFFSNFSMILCYLHLIMLV